MSFQQSSAVFRDRSAVEGLWCVPQPSMLTSSKNLHQSAPVSHQLPTVVSRVQSTGVALHQSTVLFRDKSTVVSLDQSGWCPVISQPSRDAGVPKRTRMSGSYSFVSLNSRLEKYEEEEEEGRWSVPQQPAAISADNSDSQTRCVPTKANFPKSRYFVPFHLE